MNEEDEAFEELSRKQGYWGLQGSRKHQIMRYAENVEKKENMNKPITSNKFATDLWGMMQMAIDEAVLAERDACAQIVTDDERLSVDDAIRVCRAIRARGQA
jgi:hypothetical protein